MSDAVKAAEPEVKANSEVKEEESSPKPKWGPGIPDDFDPNTYEILNSDSFTLENLIINNSVQGEVKISKELSATFRSLTVKELRELESRMYSDADRETATHSELQLRPAIKSIVSMQFKGKAFEFPAGSEELEEQKDVHVRNMSIPLVNEFVLAYNWFACLTALLVRGTDLKNS